jgi:two-component system sensor histidine kinase KdpD
MNSVNLHDGAWVNAGDHRSWAAASTPRQYLLAAAVVIGVALAGFIFVPLVGVHAIALIFLLAVVLLALFVDRGPTLLAAAMSALLWDYFFLPPVFAFRVTHFEDAMLLLMYFVIALVLGQLTGRIHAQEVVAQLREERATALYLLTRDLSGVADEDQLTRRIVAQLERVFGAQVVIFLSDRPYRLNRAPHPASTYAFPDRERRVAVRAFDYGQPAGKFTDNLPDAGALYLPLVTGGGAVGVMGLDFGGPSPPRNPQRQLLDAFARQIALALDRQRLDNESEQVKRLAESERLSKNLLNSMSHEVRTPLAAIKSATSHLLELEGRHLSSPQQALVAEIEEAVERLDRLFGKVLDSTRLESGRVKPRLSLCDVSDLIHIAVKETLKEMARHTVTVEIAAGLPLVNADFVLLQEALMNLLSNAAFHTPAGTAVKVSAHTDGAHLVLSVSDSGPGLHPQSLARVFDKFYRAPTAPTGGTGLGLSLVKGFVEAQGGKVKAANREEGGALFTICLPLRPNPLPSLEPVL